MDRDERTPPRTTMLPPPSDVAFDYLAHVLSRALPDLDSALLGEAPESDVPTLLAPIGAAG